MSALHQKRTTGSHRRVCHEVSYREELNSYHQACLLIFRATTHYRDRHIERLEPQTSQPEQMRNPMINLA